MISILQNEIEAIQHDCGKMAYQKHHKANKIYQLIL